MHEFTEQAPQVGRGRLLLVVALLLGACGNTKAAGEDATATGADSAVDSTVTSDGKTPDGIVDTVTADSNGDAVTPGDALSDGAPSDGDSVTADITGICPGGANCPCTLNSDCDNNICLEAPDGHRCGIDCGGGACPGGFSCTLINQSGGDAQYICVPKWGRLCEPCDNSKLCSSALGNEKGVCIAYGGLEGSFCGSFCASDGECPTGYGCKDVTSIEGKSAKQCARLPDGAAHIQCPCDANATTQKLATTCNAAVATGGSCPGVRSCTATGLSACTASPSATELCDGIDNDCNGLTDDVVCDDKNLCTDDACQPTEQTCTHAPNALVCSDGNACTTGDSCAVGLCTGATISCDDQNPCTSDSCDPKLGCQHENPAIPCSDGNACTVGDTCIDSSCVPGKKVDCDDKNACTSDSCDPISGLCVHVKLSDNACTDGDFCTSGDTCVIGKCVGQAVSCDDNNPCTLDTCAAGVGCEHAAQTTGCDDGNPCTVGDSCIDTVCISGAQKDCNDQNGCTSDSCDTTSGNCVNKPLNGTACNDGNACTVADACTDTTCTGKTKNCDDSNTCTSDSCDPKTGCTYSNVQGSCEDGNACTLGDACVGNVCTPGIAKNCDDTNACTADSCDAATGTCGHTALPGATCNDGNACTDSDQCGGGSAGPTGCAGVTKSCDDSNVCTDDSCDTTSGCQHVGNSKSCDDGNACTSGDTCVTFFGISGCAGTAINAATACDDKNACTTDACSPTSGCTYTPKTNAQCDDYNPCTQNDTCNVNGVCVSGQNICGCTQDIECQQPNANPCAGVLYCDKAAAPYYCKIKAGTVVNCDTSQDGQCKSTACDATTGKCATSALADQKPCNADGSVCTVNDACLGGVCTAGGSVDCNDKNPCTDDSCDPVKSCVNTANVAPCEDGNACTIGDSCNNTVCLPGAATVCNDGNACTADSCDKVTGKCVFDGTPFNATGCDADGSICTQADSCQNGTCTAGIPLVCTDTNPCTDNVCDPVAGCKFPFNAASCNDKDLCTIGDTCSSGICAGTKTNCVDSTLCTDDSCDPATGACVHATAAHEGSSCAAEGDGNVCTLTDTCVAGVCTGSNLKSCDDGEQCTTDSCDPILGCQNPNVPLNTPCNDGLPCTAGDRCVPGGKSYTCVPTGTLNCDDSKPCTLDSCVNAGTGCQHDPIAAANTPSGACNDNNPCTSDACDGTAGLCVNSPLPDTSQPATCNLATQWCVAGNCKTKGCGDGYVNAATGETCEDGNTANCDGCESCQARSTVVFSGAGSGTSGFGAPSVATPYLAIDGDMTIEAWIKPANLTTTQPIVAHAALGAQFLQTYAFMVNTAGNLVFQHTPSAALGQEQVQSAATVTANVWTHVAAVVAGQQVRLYINGAPVFTKTLATKRQASLISTFVVGRRTPDDASLGFNGAIDELHIAAAPLYGAAFTPPRRVVLSAASRGLWRFDEATGSTAVDAAGTGADSLGVIQKPAYNLTLTGHTWTPDACYGAVATAGVCGDGFVASASGSFPGTEECDPLADTCNSPSQVCQDCRYRRQLSLGGSVAAITQPFTSWAADTFCPTCETTVEMWAKLDVAAQDAYYALFSVSCTALQLYISNGTVFVARQGVTQFPSPPSAATVISTGVWHHYALELGWATYAPLRLYIDGALVLDVKPALWDYTQPNPVSTLSSEVLEIGGMAGYNATTGNPLCAANGDTIDAEIPWPGEIDEVRVSSGMRYGGNFVPSRRAYPDANTRALWHMDGATSTLLDDSGKGVTTTNTSPTTCDDYYQASSAAKCGDGTLAPWEWDDGSTKATNFPSSVATPGLTCGPYWNADCSGITWTDPVAPALTTNAITYPSLPYPTATVPGSVAGPWTWEGWVRLPALPASGKIGTIAAMDSSLTTACPQSQAQAWAIQTQSDGTDASTIGPGTASVARQVWKAGVWQHFALEYHGDKTGSLWVDGQKARDFTVTSTAWSSSCKVRIGAREGGAAQTNHISGQMASLQMSTAVRYGAAFDPPWTLAKDNNGTFAKDTYLLWDFASAASASCTPDLCANGVNASGTVSAWIDIGGGSSSFIASGPHCATQPSP